MSKIKPHSAPSHGDDMYITVDKQFRLCLSSGLRKELGFAPGMELYVGYDAVNKRIGITKPDVVRLVNVRPYRFDQRGYTHARRFVLDNNIDNSRAVRYHFDGKERGGSNAGWLMFRLSGYTAPDQEVDAT